MMLLVSGPGLHFFEILLKIASFFLHMHFVVGGEMGPIDLN